MKTLAGRKGAGVAGCLGWRTAIARRVQLAAAVAVLVVGAASTLYGLASAGLAGIMEVLLLVPLVLLRALDGLLAPLLGWGALSAIAGEIGRLQRDMLHGTGESLLIAAAGLAAVLLSGTWLRRHRAVRRRCPARRGTPRMRPHDAG